MIYESWWKELRKFYDRFTKDDYESWLNEVSWFTKTKIQSWVIQRGLANNRVRQSWIFMRKRRFTKKPAGYQLYFWIS